jgi:hypothetical protein
MQVIVKENGPGMGLNMITSVRDMMKLPPFIIFDVRPE